MEAGQSDLIVDELPRVQAMARVLCYRAAAPALSDDLAQAGMVGLIEAVQKYEPLRQIQFWSYAQHRVRGAMLDYLREWDWAPRQLRKQAKAIESSRHKLSLSLARTPLDEEIAQDLGLDLKEFQTLTTEIDRFQLLGMGEPESEDYQHGPAIEEIVSDAAEDPFRGCLSRQHQRILSHMLAQLSPRQRQVLILYYYRDLTMEEIAKFLGIGSSRVSQLHTAGLQRLRTLIETQKMRREFSPSGEEN
jgi:RNA polymerase sigma factor for flagellar operon FliA